MELAARAMALASLVAQATPDKHDDLRRWFAAEAAFQLRRTGALGAAREHMEFALRDLDGLIAECGVLDVVISSTKASPQLVCASWT